MCNIFTTNSLGSNPFDLKDTKLQTSIREQTMYGFILLERWWTRTPSMDFFRFCWESASSNIYQSTISDLPQNRLKVNIFALSDPIKGLTGIYVLPERRWPRTKNYSGADTVLLILTERKDGKVATLLLKFMDEMGHCSKRNRKTS